MDVMGVDCYNLCGTGSIGRTLATSSGGLNEHIPVVCFVPEQNHCATYREDKVSATLQTGYHFGGGGDAALILEKHEMPVVSIEGNGARPSHRGGVGIPKTGGCSH